MSFTALPSKAGIGLRSPHYQEVLDRAPSEIAWVEVHSENFLEGGAALHFLRKVAECYPVALHGVGLGLGSCERPDPAHLAALKDLSRAIVPALVSEHLSFNHACGGQYVNDLLPNPYTRRMLKLVSEHVCEVQDTLQRTICLENLSSYLAYPHNEMSEAEFLTELVRRTDCTLLLDINNVYVNQVNLGQDAAAFLAALPGEAIKAIHLAGYTERNGMLIDTHSQRVQEPVWALYRNALARFGRKPTLVEWDNDIPALPVLLDEAVKAQRILDEVSHAMR
jgi:uncharacterized protein (UPF0276 family)